MAKSRLSSAQLAGNYLDIAESVLRAMISSTLERNFPVVLILNRPLFHACYKGLWICLVGAPKIPDNLLILAGMIDTVIEQRFAAWGRPPCTPGTLARYRALLDSPALPTLVNSGKVARSNVIARLHADTHIGPDALNRPRKIAEHGGLLRIAHDLCVIAHDPLYSRLRFAVHSRFPEILPELGPDFFLPEILHLYKIANSQPSTGP